MDIFRTTREGATAGASVPQLDLTTKSIITVPRKIARAESTRNITYRVSLKDEAPDTILPSDRRQSLRPATAKNSAILVVKTAGPRIGNAGDAQVDDKYLRPNAYITSGDPTVRNHAVKAVAAAVDPWDKAVRITKWVSQNLKNKNFETAFASPARWRRPSRATAPSMASWSPRCAAPWVSRRGSWSAWSTPRSSEGFGFHMWNEVYVNRRWVAVDAAFRPVRGLTRWHIKLADAGLEGVSPYESFLTVVRVMGKMTLERWKSADARRCEVRAAFEPPDLPRESARARLAGPGSGP